MFCSCLAYFDKRFVIFGPFGPGNTGFWSCAQFAICKLAQHGAQFGISIFSFYHIHVKLMDPPKSFCGPRGSMDPGWEPLAMRYICNIKFGMFQARENDISLPKWSGGTAHASGWYCACAWSGWYCACAP